MPKPDAPVSLADLAAAGIRLRPYEAATIVRQLILKVAGGEMAGVPSPHVIRLWPSGDVSIEGPVAAGGREVVRATQLLEALLPEPRSGDGFRVPGGLRLLIARGLGMLDVPPYASLCELADALTRFAAADARATIAELVVSWVESVELHEMASPDGEAALASVEPFAVPTQVPGEDETAGALTVSDIRRARRATGLPLSQVSERAGIPLSLLRQLEWGYLEHWPDGPDGRAQLVRYAEATGLDERIVVAALAPLIGSTQRPHPLPFPAPAAAVSRKSGSRHSPARADRNARRHVRWAAALAIPAMVVLGVLPMWRDAGSRIGPHEPEAPLVRTDTHETPVQAAPRPAPSAPPALQPVARSAGQASRRQGDAIVSAAGPGPRTSSGPARAVEGPVMFSPVGTAMFYEPEQEVDAGGVRRVDTSGREAVLRVTRIVDDNANNFHVRPSPDGTLVAFDSDRDGERGVYIANADGADVRKVSPAGFAAIPSWSPDGKSLAFVRAEDDRPAVWNLWTLELASGALTQLTRHRSGQPFGASWFPDGRQIAYGIEDRLVILDRATGRARAFPSPRKGRFVREPAVSPDGRRIMFQVTRDGAWLLELADGSMRRVLDDPSAEAYAWSPDGRQVAYHSQASDGWNVWIRTSR